MNIELPSWDPSSLNEEQRARYIVKVVGCAIYSLRTTFSVQCKSCGKILNEATTDPTYCINMHENGLHELLACDGRRWLVDTTKQEIVSDDDIKKAIETLHIANVQRFGGIVGNRRRDVRIQVDAVSVTMLRQSPEIIEYT